MPWLMSLSPAGIVIALLFATNIVAFGAWRLTAHNLQEAEQKVATCRAQHDAFVAQTTALGKAAEEKAKSIEAERKKVADETAKGWAAAIDTVRADYSRRLRLANGNPGRGVVPASAEDRQGHAGASADAIPSPERIAADCAETTVTANFLQGYIERLEAQ